MPKKTKKDKADAHLQRMETRGVGPSNRNSRQQQQRLTKREDKKKGQQGYWECPKKSPSRTTTTLENKHLAPRHSHVPDTTKVNDVVSQLTKWIYDKDSLADCLGQSQGQLRITICKKYQTQVHLLEYHPNHKTLTSVRSIIHHATRRGIDIKLV